MIYRVIRPERLSALDRIGVRLHDEDVPNHPQFLLVGKKGIEGISQEKSNVVLGELARAEFPNVLHRLKKIQTHFFSLPKFHSIAARHSSLYIAISET
jgi:hypothetical protein